MALDGAVVEIFILFESLDDPPPPVAALWSLLPGKAKST